jgi:hypothetical protein
MDILCHAQLHFTVEPQIYIEFSLLYIWLTSLKEIQTQFLSPRLFVHLKHIDDIVIFACQLWPKYDFNADLYLLQCKIWRDKKNINMTMNSFLTQRWQCHQYVLIRINSTRTITRMRSQGPAPGLSLSIILTLLSMISFKLVSHIYSNENSI